MRKQHGARGGHFTSLHSLLYMFYRVFFSSAVSLSLRVRTTVGNITTIYRRYEIKKKSKKKEKDRKKVFSDTKKNTSSSSPAASYGRCEKAPRKRVYKINIITANNVVRARRCLSGDPLNHPREFSFAPNEGNSTRDVWVCIHIQTR